MIDIVDDELVMQGATALAAQKMTLAVKNNQIFLKRGLILNFW